MAQTKEKTWCTWNGMKCKDENCPNKHIDIKDIPKSCDSVYELGKGKYVVCELNKGHKELHTALNHKWGQKLSMLKKK